MSHFRRLAPLENRYDTIIIGAGVSGLACASRLLQKARQDGRQHRLLVLEARDRIGGRVNSVHVSGCRLDTGANWIHGVGTADQPNPLMDILPSKRVRELSGSVAFKPPPSSDREERGNGDWILVQDHPFASPNSTKTGDLVIPPQVAGILMGTMWYLFDSLHDVASSTPVDEAKKQTMLQAITSSEIFREAFDQVPKGYHQALRAMPQFIENMEAAPLVAQSAEGERDTAGMGLLEFAIDDFAGAQVFVQDGYTAVVDELATEVRNAGLIELSSEVDEINWENDNVKVKTKNDKVFEGSNLVVTLPLGVLKARHDTLFHPSLPQDKRDGIHRLGFGTLDKIFMIYDRAWWTEEPFASIIRKGLVNSPRDPDKNQDSANEPDIMMGFTRSLPGLSIHPDGSSEPGIRILSLANLHSLTGYPVLSCFVSCSNARQVEALSDAHAQQLLHTNMTAWFGKEPPSAKAVHVTRWANDTFSMGSYSHMIAGLSETKHREQFQDAIQVGGRGRLAFAGEHTSRNHFATVHGALISGWREADAIISMW